MKAHAEDAHRQLGELAVMSKQTDDMERTIMGRAETRLSDIEGQISDARVSAMTGDDDAKSHYIGLIEERGRLHQVIARSRKSLGTS